MLSAMPSAPAPRDPVRPDVRLRPLAAADADDAADVAAVLALNHAEVVNLAPMDEPRLEVLRGLADRFDVIEVDGAFGGFVVTFAPGTAYDSENYRWFASRFPDGFYYLDRVVLDPSVRRRGVAGVVYDELEAVAAAYRRMVLEVNLRPRNAASLAFHARRGYAEVGQLGDEAHLVSLQVKELAGGPV